MSIEEMNQPVVNVVCYVQLCHLVQQRVMSYRVEGLTEVSYDDDKILQKLQMDYICSTV